MVVYRIISTAGFERDVRRATRRDSVLLTRLAGALEILENDPMNFSRHYDISKLTGIKAGQGQWRLRVGDYRIRYDIFGRDVVLYTFRHRREAY
jgi:mRNA-degrading endonuclease RelE of RelBE toxin-antitoxin system